MKKVKNDMDKSEICETADICKSYFINNIPDEVLLLIFSFLNIKELCNNVAPVCRHWYTLAYYPCLWLELHLSNDFHSNQTMLRLIEKSPYLLHLIISRSENAGNLLKAVAKNCCRLKQLTINLHGGLTKDIFEVIVENLCKLEVLIIQSRIHSPVSFYKLLEKLKYLTHLDLSYSTNYLDDYRLIMIAEQCEQLQYLGIKNQAFINDLSVMRLIELRGSSLTDLYLHGEQMTDEGFHALSGCIMLQCLEISFCEGMTDYGLLGIKELSKLTCLKLCKCCHLTAHGLRDFFAEGKLNRLTLLDLSECTKLNDSVISYLSNKCLSITHLCLDRCYEVTDVGLVEIIQNCPHIRTLRLTDLLQITGAPFRSINSHLPYLTLLSIEGCDRIDDTIIRNLVYDKPSLMVLHCYKDQLLHSLQQHYVKIKEKEKNKKLFELLRTLEYTNVVIFVKSIQHCMSLQQLLEDQNFPAIVIHHVMEQEGRLARYQQFKDFQKCILVATDLFMDIELVNIVFNYDIPDNSNTYLHRVARAWHIVEGTMGMCITFISKESDFMILNEVKERFYVNITKLTN